MEPWTPSSPPLTLAAMPKLSLDWFLHDPTGKMVAAGVGVALALVALWFILGTLQWAAGHLKAIMGVAVLVGAGLWGVQYVTRMPLVAWAFVAAGAFGGIVGFALWKTRN